MAKRHGVPEIIRKKNEQELSDWACEHEDEIKLVQLGTYHFRIYPKGKSTIDVWPSRKKFMATKGTVSQTYKNITDLNKIIKI